MRLLGYIFFSAVILSLSSAVSSSQLTIETIGDYNSRLPYWGTVWNPGSDSVSRYYPSFYTGFAPRSQFPDRIHVRTSRGNQTRVTVILDDQTLIDYLFDLETRYKTYKALTASNGIMRLAAEKNALPQLKYFFQILESPVYGIIPFAERARNGLETREAIYAKALNTIETLNPGRVFHLTLDLNKQFGSWGDILSSLLVGRDPQTVFTAKSKETIIALNTIVFGRVNFTAQPSSEMVAALVEAARQNQNSAHTEFVQTSLKLFRLLTSYKYGFKSLNGSGAFQNTIICDDGYRCTLSYSEFTAIYPTGSAETVTTDRYGNRIQDFATPGLWQFLSYNSGGRDFDNIRKEPYYGFIPKMDFEGIGNGFHNPAVTFWSVGKDVKSGLNIPSQYNAFGAVKRGGVSSGCLRLAAGHLWELRHIFPVENSVATKVYFFGNDSKDFDLFDINGDGALEVMGVDYMISYSVAGAGGLAKRDGGSMELKSKVDFAANLYGKSQVFEVANQKIYFKNPTISFPSYLDLKKKSVSTSLELPGIFPLYEQSYERDKIQFYAPISVAGLTEMSQAPVSKRIVRLMGRIRGCAPFSDQNLCGATAFKNEAFSLLKELGAKADLP